MYRFKGPLKGVSKRVAKTFMLVAQGGFPSVPCGAACAKVDCVWGSHRAAAQLEHISLRVIAISII